jgi:plastocyanin
MKKKLISKSKLIAVILFLFALLGLTNSCKKAADTPSANEVYIENMAFTPSTLNVYVNATVTWTNKDAAAHTVTSDAVLFESGSIPSNGTFSYTFTSVGTFHYHCSFHSSMVGTVVVTAVPAGIVY